MTIAPHARDARLKRFRSRATRRKDVALYGRAAHLPPGLLDELLPGEHA